MASPFGDLSVTQDPADESYWILDQPLTYNGNAGSYTVDANFRTNYASVPNVYRWLIPRSGRYAKPSVLHDWQWSVNSTVPRCEADRIFRDVLHEAGVSALRRWLMWGAVRLASFLQGCGVLQATLVVLLALAILPFVLVAGGVVLVFLLLFYYAEYAVYYVIKQFNPAAVAPTFFWST